MKVAGVNIKEINFDRTTKTSKLRNPAGSKVGMPTSAKSDAYAREAKKRASKWLSSVS